NPRSGECQSMRVPLRRRPNAVRCRSRERDVLVVSAISRTNRARLHAGMTGRSRGEFQRSSTDRETLRAAYRLRRPGIVFCPADRDAAVRLAEVIEGSAVSRLRAIALRSFGDDSLRTEPRT